MSKIFSPHSILLLFVVVFPLISSASFSTGADVLNFFINVFFSLFPLLVGIAVLVFFWGLVKFLTHAGNQEAIAEAKQLIMWGLIAVTIMVSFWGIIGFLQESFFLGITTPTPLGDLVLSPTTIP